MHLYIIFLLPASEREREREKRETHQQKQQADKSKETEITAWLKYKRNDEAPRNQKFAYPYREQPIADTTKKQKSTPD